MKHVSLTLRTTNLWVKEKVATHYVPYVMWMPYTHIYTVFDVYIRRRILFPSPFWIRVHALEPSVF
uniref:N-alpha-acetyltransferase 50 n=1 Tax=Rhizophora mucronata TaxID=61149 RepID=A0A2P2KDK0_RHIMU